MGQIFVNASAGGSNQSGLRDRNARLVMSYIRRHHAMASAEIARRSGLSAQTVSNIVRALEADGLLRRGQSVRGRVGKPSVPMALNPDGAHALGLNIGRRSLEMVLVDLTGQQVDARSIAYDFPSVDAVFGFVREVTPALIGAHGLERARIAGLGVARPGRIWSWLEIIGAPEAAMQQWRDLDLGTEIGALTGLPVVLENDATSACVAEHVLGRGPEFRDFAYIFLGAFVGGGLVLDDKIVSGRTRNAAALGPLPVPDAQGGHVQLLDVASLHVLERSLTKSGRDPALLRDPALDWQTLEPALGAWIDSTAKHLAICCAAINSVVEVEAVVIDGAFSPDVRARLTRQTSAAFDALEVTGMDAPVIVEASVGRRARSIGAALLPIHTKFFLA